MPRPRRGWRLAAVLAALAWWSLSDPAPVLGQGNLQVGPLRILPVLEVSGEGP
jgi:hypothetical protein